MVKNSSINLDVTPNADGYSIAGGTTPRTLTVTGGNLTLSNSGTGTYTFPSTGTVVTQDSTDTLTNKTLTAPKFASGGFIADSNGNELVRFPSTVASAVNELTISNSITLSQPSIAATGGDANIGIELTSKGTGIITANGQTIATANNTLTLTNKIIDGSQLVNSTVTASKLNLGPVTAFTATDQTTTSTSFTDLATVTSATVTVGANGLAFVTWSAGIYNVAVPKSVSVAVSGASTVAADDTWAIRNDIASFNQTSSTSYLFTGLTPGSNTFTMKFKTASGTANFFNRRITVIPL